MGSPNNGFRNTRNFQSQEQVLRFLRGHEKRSGPKYGCDRSLLDDGRSTDLILGKGKWGGKTYRAILGEGGTCFRARLPKPVLEGSESGIGLVCARFLKMTGRAQTGGKMYHR